MERKVPMVRRNYFHSIGTFVYLSFLFWHVTMLKYKTIIIGKERRVYMNVVAHR